MTGALLAGPEGEGLHCQSPGWGAVEGEGAGSGAAEGSRGQQGMPGSEGRPVELPTGPVGCRPVHGHLAHSVLAEPRDTVTCKQPCLCHMHKGSSRVSLDPA